MGKILFSLYKIFQKIFSEVSYPNFMAPSKVIIIRHGEKINDELPQLSPEGEARAVMLRTFFQHGSPFGDIDTIYAAKPRHAGSSIRPQQTVAHVAEDWHLEINLDYEREAGHDDESQKKLAKHILSHNYHGKSVLICWEHDSIRNLIKSLGGPDVGKWGKSYSKFYVLNYHHDSYHSGEEREQWDVAHYPADYPAPKHI